MKLSSKILFFLITTLLLGTMIYLIIAKEDANNPIDVEESNELETIMENVNYTKYVELRSEAHETESYAIVIYDSEEPVSNEFVEEVKVSFAGRKSTVYLLDTKELNAEEYSTVIDDVTKVMKYKEPQIIVPTIIVMNKGNIVYKHAGFIYKEELMENLNSKSIE